MITNRLILAVAVLLTSLITGSTALAVDARNFKPGRIIEDGVFTNSNSMSVADIQAFLDSKMTNCDTYGTERAGSGSLSITNRQWIEQNYGISPPYRCVRDYRENPTTGESNYGKATAPAGSISAAELIYNYSRQFNINPQVIIATLQKENGMITDNIPIPRQYQQAMGFGCPDNVAPGEPACDPRYNSFSNQLYQASRHFRGYIDRPAGWTVPYRPGWNTILWNPSSSCGTSSVFIENSATAALYSYTPYRPNQAALNAQYGYGDSCSSYGNRNFYLFFNDWFNTPQYAASWVSQSAYPTVNPGGSVTVSITYRNSGSSAWYDNISAANNNTYPTRLGTANNYNRSSQFGLSWGGDRNRASGEFSTVYDVHGNPYTVNPHIVKSGESATFTFTLQAAIGLAAGTYPEYFAPLVEGVGYMNASTVFLNINVPKIVTASYAKQSPYPTIAAGRSSESFIAFKNTGNTPWYDERSTSLPKLKIQAEPLDRTSPFNSDWESANTPSNRFKAVYNSSYTTLTDNQSVVHPGEIAVFPIKFSVPVGFAAGDYTENFVITDQANNHIADTYAWLRVSVPTKATALSESPTNNISSTINPDHDAIKTYKFTNTGNTTWLKASTSIGIAKGDATIYGSSLKQGASIAILNEDTVSPGGIGTFTLSYRAPYTKTSATITIAPMIDGSFIEGATTVTLTTPQPRNWAEYAGQSAYPVIKQGSTADAYFRFKNAGNAPWYKDWANLPSGASPAHLATSNSINRRSELSNPNWGRDSNRPARIGKVYLSDGKTLSTNQTKVMPGEIAEYNFVFTANQLTKEGTYREWFQPILEGASQWDMGGYVFLDVRVKEATFTAKYRGQSDYPTLRRGETKELFFMFENSGSATWHNINGMPPGLNPLVLATTNPINRHSIFFISNRPSRTFTVYENNATTLSTDQSIVKPGQVAKFQLTAQAPTTAKIGTYREWFQPIVEGGSPWDMYTYAFLDFRVIE